jgi:hypothetical protein
MIGGQSQERMPASLPTTPLPPSSSLNASGLACPAWRAQDLTPSWNPVALQPEIGPSVLLDGNPNASDHDQLVEGIFAMSMTRTLPAEPRLCSINEPFICFPLGGVAFICLRK